MQRVRQALMILSLGLVLAGCGLGLGGDEAPPSHPIVERFTINGETGALIVSTAQTLRLSAELRSPTELERVSFYANGVLLQTFTAPPYVYEWPVTAVDNGFYDFRVEVMDMLGNEVVAQYPDLLGINID